MATVAKQRARVGDELVVTGHAVGEAPRVGEILEILDGERPHYRVRWEDGHESVLAPSSDVTFKRHRRTAKPR